MDIGALGQGFSMWAKNILEGTGPFLKTGKPQKIFFYKIFLLLTVMRLQTCQATSIGSKFILPLSLILILKLGIFSIFFCCCRPLLQINYKMWISRYIDHLIKLKNKIKIHFYDLHELEIPEWPVSPFGIVIK